MQIHKSIDFPEESIGNIPFDIALGNNFGGQSPQARATKAKINKWDYIKLKRFCTAEKINKMKRQLTKWEKIFVNDTSDKGLISKYIKNLLQLNTKKPNNPIKK